MEVGGVPELQVSTPRGSCSAGSARGVTETPLRVWAGDGSSQQKGEPVGDTGFAVLAVPPWALQGRAGLCWGSTPGRDNPGCPQQPRGQAWLWVLSPPNSWGCFQGPFPLCCAMGCVWEGLRGGLWATLNSCWATRAFLAGGGGSQSLQFPFCSQWGESSRH